MQNTKKDIFILEKEQQIFFSPKETGLFGFLCHVSSPFSLKQHLISLYYNCSIRSARILLPTQQWTCRWAYQTSGGLPGYLCSIVSPPIHACEGRHIEYKGLFNMPSVHFHTIVAYLNAFGSNVTEAYEN